MRYRPSCQMTDETNQGRPLPSDLEAEFARRAKKQIRSRAKAVRLGLPEAARHARSERIVASLSELDIVRAARGVALFWPMVERGEVDLRPLLGILRDRDVATFFPFMEPKEGGFSTGFREVRRESDLVERGRGFVEPTEGPAAARGQIDVVIVPALAVDSRGYRVGYGAGYYDATLGDLCPPAVSVVVCYDFELMAELPIERHDVRCDLVVTDKKTLRPA
ncbi:MAG: 5-formyltetrahydrofolate cyclo-ligase [Sorangiineae bacterium NIC37A_2]|nr:MAG: 5-formyltetrahydrofolate cyclo-ligase [Sorangiineae bacterium NIC37A_2]